MSEHKKKPGIAFWATVVLVAVLLGYPLSFGPACWISCWTDEGQEAVSLVYRPITWTFGRPTIDEIPDEIPPIGQLFQGYARLAARPTWHWYSWIRNGKRGEPQFVYWKWNGLRREVE